MAHLESSLDSGKRFLQRLCCEAVPSSTPLPSGPAPDFSPLSFSKKPFLYIFIILDIPVYSENKIIENIMKTCKKEYIFARFKNNL
jgi:hypothetical protein